MLKHIEYSYDIYNVCTYRNNVGYLQLMSNYQLSSSTVMWKRDTRSRWRISPNIMAPKSVHNLSSSEAFHIGT